MGLLGVGDPAQGIETEHRHLSSRGKGSAADKLGMSMIDELLGTMRRERRARDREHEEQVARAMWALGLEDDALDAEIERTIEQGHAERRRAREGREGEGEGAGGSSLAPKSCG